MKKTFTMKAAISLVLILCVIFCGMPVYAQTTEGESVSATDSAPASEPTVTTPSDTAGAPSSEPTVETVSDVEAIDLAIPVFGANPDFDVTVPANGKFAVSSVRWEKLESTTTEFITTVLSANDKFEEGEYQVTITFRATGGAKFKANANGVITGRINGDVAMPASSVTNDGLYDTYAICTVFSVEASSQPTVETVSDVEANDLTVPAYGANPDFDLTVPANAKFAIDTVKWEKVESTQTSVTKTELSANDTFEEGDYQVTITFRVADGAKFKVNADGVITSRLNGNVAMPVSSVTNDGLYDTYTIYAEFTVDAPAQPAVETVSDVEANDLTVPAYGANPDFDLTVPANAKFAIDTVKWEKVESTQTSVTKTEISANDTFEEGDYQVTITFRVADGVKFKVNADGVITSRLNGNVAMPISSVTNDGLYDTYTIYAEFTVDAPAQPAVETVSDVEANDLTVPAYGANPDFDLTVPANAKFAIDTVKWEKIESTETSVTKTEISANDTFEEGDYQVTITFRVADGAKFKVNADGVITSRLNGDVAMPISSVTNDGLYDTYTIYAEFTVEKETKYEMLEGMNGKWIRSEGRKILRFRANGDFKKFVRVLVDGREIDRRHYAASEGSTIIELNDSYLASLANGKHELTVVFTDGEVSTNFNIQPTSEGSYGPKTGDSDIVGICAALMIYSLCIMLAYAHFYRKKGNGMVIR